MKWILVILLSILASLAHAQAGSVQHLQLEELEETMECEDKIDKTSKHYKTAMEAGAMLVKYRISDCDQYYNPDERKDKISRIESKSDQLSFQLQLTKNCCIGTTAAIEIIDASTWNFIIAEQEEGCPACFCQCCFTAFFEVKNETDTAPTSFRLNGAPLLVSGSVIRVKSPRE